MAKDTVYLAPGSSADCGQRTRKESQNTFMGENSSSSYFSCCRDFWNDILSHGSQYRATHCLESKACFYQGRKPHFIATHSCSQGWNFNYPSTPKFYTSTEGFRRRSTGGLSDRISFFRGKTRSDKAISGTHQ